MKKLTVLVLWEEITVLVRDDQYSESMYKSFKKVATILASCEENLTIYFKKLSVVKFLVAKKDMQDLQSDLDRLQPCTKELTESFTIYHASSERARVRRYEELSHTPSKQGVPLQPDRPKIYCIGEGKFKLYFRKPTKEEENGSTNTKMIIQHRSITDEVWETKQCKALPGFGFVVTEILNLKLDLSVTQEFRIKLKGDFGESEASPTFILRPEDLIPGKPQLLNVYCKANAIKVTWTEPKIHLAACGGYLVNMKRRGERWKVLHKTTKKELIIKKLMSDTKYFIRVCAVQKKSKDIHGDYSDVWELKTKHVAVNTGLRAARGVGGKVAGLFGSGRGEKANTPERFKEGEEETTSTTKSDTELEEPGLSQGEVSTGVTGAARNVPVFGNIVMPAVSDFATYIHDKMKAGDFDENNPETDVVEYNC